MKNRKGRKKAGTVIAGDLRTLDPLPFDLSERP